MRYLFCYSFICFVCSLSTFAQDGLCDGSIRYVDWDTPTSSEDPIAYCYSDFEILPGTPVVKPIEGVFVPFFITTDASLSADDETYTGSTLSSSAGTIYDIVASGRVNNGEATKYIHFINLTAADVAAGTVTISFEDASGACKHSVDLDPSTLNIETACPVETTDCDFAFKVEFIDWSSFTFVGAPIAYCAEELSSMYPEANGTFEGGRTDLDKPGVFIPFSVRTNALPDYFENSTLSISEGAIYRASEPPMPNDGTASTNIYFMYLIKSNFEKESITISFADSSNVCVLEKVVNVVVDLEGIDPDAQCISDSCGDDTCDGVEDYANCPNDCSCTGAIEFISWPAFSTTTAPQYYCAEELTIDSIGFFGGNTNMINPGIYIPFVINTEALPNDDNIFEGSAITTDVGVIYNSTNPPSINDGTAATGVHFLYLTDEDLSKDAVQLSFTDGFGGCNHIEAINITDELPESVPQCPCAGAVRFINWEDQEIIDNPTAYCAEELGDFENWGTNVDTPLLFIPFVVQTGALVGTDSITYTGSAIDVSAGTIYNSTIPPTPNSGEATVFIQLLAVSEFDLEKETISINFTDTTGNCVHSTQIAVATDLFNISTETCLEAECGNGVCEAVEDYESCPDDCPCQGVIRFLEVEEWPTLATTDKPVAYCVEEIITPGTDADTDPQNPGVYIPFSIQTQSALDTSGVYLDGKINTSNGTIYDITVPPMENDGDPKNVHYLYLSFLDLETGGNEIEITFSDASSECIHDISIDLAEDLPDLDPLKQCLEFECGDTICGPAETFADCPDDCSCTGAIEFVDWEDLSITDDPIAYCFEDIVEGLNMIDPENPGVFVPFRVRSDAPFGEDSIFTNSVLQASVGKVYDNLEIPIANNGMASIFAQFLYLSPNDLNENENTTISFKDESEACEHNTTINFEEQLSDDQLPVDCFMGTDVNEFLLTHSIFEVQPNPVKDVLQLQFSKDLTDQPELISIYNLHGQQIVQLKGSDYLISNQKKIEFAEHAKGTYFVEITTKDGKVFAKRFVKQ